MFEALKEQESEVLPVVQQFLALYAKFTAGASWLAKRQAEGLDNRPHLADFRRLEAQTDKMWDSMAQEQKEACYEALNAKKAIPDEICQAKELFGGKIVRVK